MPVEIDMDLPFYEQICHCGHSLELHRDEFGEWGKCERKGCECEDFLTGEVWSIFCDAEMHYCRCGHEEDDHSPSRGNVCDLSFACLCQGFQEED